MVVTNLRRGRDLNPRGRFRPQGFRDLTDKPLQAPLHYLHTISDPLIFWDIALGGDFTKIPLPQLANDQSQ